MTGSDLLIGRFNSIQSNASLAEQLVYFSSLRWKDGRFRVNVREPNKSLHRTRTRLSRGLLGERIPGKPRTSRCAGELHR